MSKIRVSFVICTEDEDKALGIIQDMLDKRHKEAMEIKMSHVEHKPIARKWQIPKLENKHKKEMESIRTKIECWWHKEKE